MAKLYCDLIRAGLRTIEQVPARWRGAVLAMLGAAGPSAS
jgi:hypothetical protein